MNTEYTGPVEVWGHAEFPDQGLWDVHGAFKTEALYANGVQMGVSAITQTESSSTGTRDGYLCRVETNE
jgi:hypothetical protein